MTDSAGRTIELSREDARRLFLRAHGLLGPKATPGIGSVLRVLERFRLVQVDSIGVAGTNQDISFSSRIEGFTPQQLDTVLYETHGAFEYWQKCLCILPAESRPYYLPVMDRLAEHHAAFVAEHRKTVEHILRQLREAGPLAPGDLGDDRTRVGAWGSTERIVKRVMEVLWEAGTLVIARRNGRMRLYDIAERHFSANDRATKAAYRRRALLDVYSALRLFAVRGTTGEVWHGVKPFRHAVHEELVAEGVVVPVRIEGVRRNYFMLSEDADLLNGDHEADGPVRLLAPLDSALWDRRIVRELFDFDVTFEVYTPVAKRRFGYYCLPILLDAEIVGRVDVGSDRSSSAMLVRSIHWEHGVDPFTGDLLPRLASVLADHRRFMGLTKMRLPRRRSPDVATLRNLLRP